MGVVARQTASEQIEILEETNAMTSSRTILHVYGGIPMKLGSLEEYYVALTRRLTDAGWRSVFVLTGEIEPALRRHYDEVGAEYVYVPKDAGSRRSRVARYRRLIQELRPALLNAAFGYPAIESLIAARLAPPCPSVWTKHSFYDRGPYYYRVPQAKLWFSSVFLGGLLTDRVIAVSAGVERELRLYHVPGRKIRQVYLGVRLARFRAGGAPPTRLPGVPDDARVVACISQARPEKGLEHLARAMARVRTARRDVVCVVVGGGELTADLQAMSQNLGIADAMVFLGVRNDVENIIARAEFTVLPSLTEGLPLVVLESLAGGRPVIASRVGGIPEVITDGNNGFLVPARDEAALADRILRLLGDEQELGTMQARCSGSVDRFDLSRGVEHTLSVYRELVPAL
jgi:glycosyltransferase involved in cell wall biosynthesis